MRDPQSAPRGLLGASPATERGRALSVFYASGGLLNVASMALPGWPGRDLVVLGVVAAVALAAALGLLALGDRLPLAGAHALVAAGSVLIAVVVVGAGGGAASASYAGYYVWVAVYVAVYFTVPAALVHGVLATVAQAVALRLVGDADVLPAQLLLSVGTVAATGVVVGLLTARVRALAATDELTGLANRRALDAALERALAEAARGTGPFAVASLDLDGFKALNDAEGHARGDRALTEVARAWSAVLRSGDLLARSGGDEFVALLAGCDAARAREVAERLVATTPLPLSVCVGVIVVDEAGGVTPSQVLLRADRALYLGKAQGSGTVVAG